VEFAERDELLRLRGTGGIRGFLADDGRGRITDDTQMTLFTAEGMIRARVRFAGKGICHEATVIDHAYSRWLETQGLESARWRWDADGWLIGRTELHASRAPGETCLSGLRAPRQGTIDAPLNQSKGCGAVMRAAPIGMVPGWSSETRFRLGAEAGALTHGHPTGYLASGFLAATVGALLEGTALRAAIAEARKELIGYQGHEEVLRAVDAALANASRHGLPDMAQIEAFGGGWVAEEALGIAIWVALATEDVGDGLAAAVTHSGDSDSTGAIAGNLLGAALGVQAVPLELIEGLVEREVVELVALDVINLLASAVLPDSVEVEQRYPGW
jgi:ADP-ribosylglycohydrolase